MKVLVGTKNPGKIEAVKIAFDKYFDDVEVEGIKVSSDVAEQPINEEIAQGAKNRIKNLKEYANENNIEADYYVSVEAGITNCFGEWIDFNFAVVEDSKGLQSVGVSQGFEIPDRYMDEIKEKSLGFVMDRIFSGNELSKGTGGISKLTKEQVTRIEIVSNGVVMALIKHINGDLWK